MIFIFLRFFKICRSRELFSIISGFFFFLRNILIQVNFQSFAFLGWLVLIINQIMLLSCCKSRLSLLNLLNLFFIIWWWRLKNWLSGAFIDLIKLRPKINILFPFNILSVFIFSKLLSWISLIIKVVFSSSNVSIIPIILLLLGTIIKTRMQFIDLF